MSPVFRHGRLRLYLLKLLDEAPRHGYEVIRLLQDRFLGVYAPSPGTIYPRLARLEEEGLVTHDEVDGKKIYRITDKGREEIRSRFDDLAELEAELTESVRDIAREISEDVRETVRNLREELTWATRDIRRETGSAAGQARDSASEPAGDQAPGRGGDAADQRAQEDEARRVREEARRARDDMRDRFRSQHRHGRREWAERADWAGLKDWKDWAGSWQDWAGHFGGQAPGADPGRAGPDDRPGGPGRSRAGTDDRPGGPGRSRAGTDDRPGGPGRGRASRPEGSGLFGDLERMAIDFATELRSAAGRSEDIGEKGLGDLWGILEDTLTRVRDEVFDRVGRHAPDDAADQAGPAGHGEPGEPADAAGRTDPAEPPDSAGPAGSAGGPATG